MMHRDEAIYARSDARGVTLTDEERGDIVAALRLADAYEARAEDTWGEDEDPVRGRWRALVTRLEVAS